MELHHSRTLLDILVALRNLMGGQRRAAARAVRYDLVALVEQALVPDFLQCPPFGLDKIIFIGDIRMLHIRPETDDIGELLPHALVLPDRLTALADERLHAVFLNLLLAIESQSLLDLELNRQAMRIPAGLAQNILALHGLIARQQILDDTREHMADMRLAIRRRRTIVKRKGIISLTLINRLLRDIMFLPELLNFPFSPDKVKIRIHFTVQTKPLLKINLLQPAAQRRQKKKPSPKIG